MRIAMLWRVPPQTHRSGHRVWEKVFKLLVDGLRARGVDITLFEPSGTHGRLRSEKDSGRSLSVAGNPYSFAWDCIQLGELFERANDFDLIHNYFDYVPLSYAGLVSIPVLTTIQDVSSAGLLPFFKKYEGRTYYVSVSDADRSTDLNYVETVYHGIDPDSFPYHETPGDYLLFSGPISPGSGARKAAETATLAGRRLLMAGTIEDSDYFKSEIEPHTAPGRIEYLGTVEPEKEKELLGRALALLHLTRRSEPFSWSAVEANACGTPVVAFSEGSIREIVTHGVNGFLVNDVVGAAEAIALAAAASRRECRKVAEERFSGRSMVESYLELYSRILDRNKREDRRPWGYFEVLSDRAEHKVKRVVIQSGKRISLQRHRRRTEHWTIISGSPVVTVNGEDICLGPGNSIDIPKEARHRIANPGAQPVVFIEVQMGDYFGEDDIERFEDDFGRVDGNPCR